MKMMIDTGAATDIIDKAVFEMINQTQTMRFKENNICLQFVVLSDCTWKVQCQRPREWKTNN